MSELPFATKAMQRLDEIEKRLLESTPELREQFKKSRARLDVSKESRPPTSGSGKKRGDPQTSANAIDLQTKISEIEELLSKEREKAKILSKEIEYRQLRYVKREQEYRKALLEYENELKNRSVLNRVSLLDTTYKKLESISKTHDTIQANIGTIQSKTSLILDEQERDITREFNTELNKLMKELEEEKKRKIEGVGNFAEKETKLRNDLERMKARIELVEQTNKSLHKRNRELKIEFNSQEGDRVLLATQINEMEEQNLKLREEITKHKENAMGLNSPGFSMDSPDREEIKRVPNRASAERLPQSGEWTQVRAQRYEKVITQLKNMLELKRKKLREVNTSLSSLQTSRTELEAMLREVVTKVKSEIRAQGDIRKRGVEELTVQDRERVVETLLSQEHVLTLLYDKTFPPRVGETLESQVEADARGEIELPPSP